MAKARVRVLRPSAAETEAETPGALAGGGELDQGPIAEDEIWDMAAFRLHDAANWMLRLTTASSSHEVRLHLMQIYDALIRDEGSLRRHTGRPTPAPRPPDDRRPDARRRTG